jgi:hypothetical protein
MRKLKAILVTSAVAIVCALLAPAVAALTLPHINVPSVPTTPTTPTVPPQTVVTSPPTPGTPASPFKCPGGFTSICTTTIGDNLQLQLQALADAAGLLPADLLNQLLTLEIPTPAGGVQSITLTVQEYIDRIAKNAIVGGKNTGFAGTPEVAVGSIAHSFGYVRTYSGGTARPYPSLAAIKADMPQYRKYTSALLASTPAVSGATAALATGPVNAATCALLTPPTTVTGSTIPASCKIGVPLVALPVAAPASPVPSGTFPPALVPKLPSAVFTHAGGQLINVQGGGWNARGADASRNIESQAGFGTAAVAAQGAKHTGGNSSSGTNVDTATRATVTGTDATLDPWPIYVPLFTSNSAVGAGTDAVDPAKAPTDSSIDFLGFGTVGSSTKVECKAGTAVIDTEAKLDALGVSGTWPKLTCSSVGSLTGDGVANFGGWPLNFHDDLAPLWDPVPPSVTAANASIAAMLATIPTSTLQTYGLLLALGYVPYVTGLPNYRPVPLPVPEPTVPTTPTVP